MESIRPNLLDVEDDVVLLLVPTMGANANPEERTHDTARRRSMSRIGLVMFWYF
jgi:hypothetical protein